MERHDDDPSTVSGGGSSAEPSATIDVRDRLHAGDVVDARAAEIERRWRELCLWDPAQPPDAEPAIPEVLLASIAQRGGRRRPRRSR